MGVNAPSYWVAGVCGTGIIVVTGDWRVDAHIVDAGIGGAEVIVVALGVLTATGRRDTRVIAGLLSGWTTATAASTAADPGDAGITTATRRSTSTGAAGASSSVAAAAGTKVCRITGGTAWCSAAAPTVIRRAIGHDGAAEDGVGEVCVVGKGRASEVGIDQAGATQVGFGEVGALQLRPAQVGTRDIAASAIERGVGTVALQIALADIGALLRDTRACPPAGLELRPRPLLVAPLALALLVFDLFASSSVKWQEKSSQ